MKYDGVRRDKQLTTLQDDQSMQLTNQSVTPVQNGVCRRQASSPTVSKCTVPSAYTMFRHISRKPQRVCVRQLSWGRGLPLPFPSFLSVLLPFPSLSPPLPPLEVGPPKIQLGCLGERCKLPQRGLGRSWSPSRNRIWCILVLKCDIWWQQFLRIN